MMPRLALFAVVLLTVFILVIVACPASAQLCPVPEGYTNIVTFNDGDVEFTLATDKLSYQVGEPVSIRFSIGNNGTEPLVIPNPAGIDPMDAITILPPGCTSMSQEGCADWLFLSPEIVYFFGGPATIQPGQCRVNEKVWNGTPLWSNDPTPPGTYPVLAGMWNMTDIFYPTGAAKIDITVGGSSGVPTLPSTWGRIKSFYAP